MGDGERGRGWGIGASGVFSSSPILTSRSQGTWILVSTDEYRLLTRELFREVNL